MARTAARGKALVAKLRANPKVRDAEALAAWLGRVKKLRHGGMSLDAARKNAGSPGAIKKQGGLNELAAEGGPEEKSEEQKAQEKMERQLLEQLEKADTKKLFGAIMEQGGIRPSSDDLAEEYRSIPKSYRRKDGMPGDQMADYLKTYYPELGVEDENDLLDFFYTRSMKKAFAA